MSSGLNFFLNETNKTPGATGAWTDVDVSADGVPVGATAVILRLVNTSVTDPYICAVRKNDSGDNRITSVVGATFHTGAMVGIDANRIFEAYIGNAACRVFLIGYTTDSTDCLLNAVDKTPAVAAWPDVDVSANIPAGAVGVIVDIENTEANVHLGGIRKKGSGNTFPYARMGFLNHFYQVCGVDADRKFQAQIDSVLVKIWLVGYFMAPIIMETNGVIYNGTLDATWENATVSAGLSPADADGVMWLAKIIWTNSDDIGVRKELSGDSSLGALVKGDGDGTNGMCAVLFCGLDASRVCERYSEVVADNKHYTIGYASPAAAAAAPAGNVGIQLEGMGII